MTDEKLQAIRERWDACNEGQVSGSVGTERYRQWLVNVAADEQDLLAEVDALREALRAVAAAYEEDMLAEIGHANIDEIREARALLGEGEATR